jgi:hypothetical protein
MFVHRWINADCMKGIVHSGLALFLVAVLQHEDVVMYAH